MSESSFEVEKKKLKDLVQKKEDTEKEVKEIKEYLEVKKVGLNVDLVDKEGFPKFGMDDIVSIRTKRNKYFRLQNDHKNLMKQIESGLVNLHKMKKVDVKPLSVIEREEEKRKEIRLEPFLVVDEVFSNSPSDLAGIKVFDRISKFGKITKMEFLKFGLKVIGQSLSKNENKTINVEVQRKEKYLKINLIPKKWSGRGLLGCHVKPL